MRAIIALSLCLLPLISAAADLVRYEPQPGSSWVGYFDPATRLFSGAKPAFILTVPETATPTPYKPGGTETPADLKARGDALAKLGAKLKADAQKMGKHVEDQRSIAEHGERCEKEATKIVAEAQALLDALRLTAEADTSAKNEAAKPGSPKGWEPAFSALEAAVQGQTVSRGKLREAEKAVEAADKVRASADATIREKMMAFFLTSADISPISITVAVGTTAGDRSHHEVADLNRWLQEVAKAKSRKDQDRTPFADHYSNGMKLIDRCAVYAKYRPTPWIESVCSTYATITAKVAR